LFDPLLPERVQQGRPQLQRLCDQRALLRVYGTPAGFTNCLGDGLSAPPVLIIPLSYILFDARSGGNDEVNGEFWHGRG